MQALNNRRVNETSLKYYGWRVLLASIAGLALSPGAVITVLIGTISPQLMTEFGVNRGQVMFSLTVFSLTLIVAAFAAGKIIDKIGARAVLLASTTLMIGALLLLAFFSHTITLFYILVGLFAVVSIGAGSITFNKLLSLWFVEKRGLALGIAATGLGLAYAILPVIINGALAIMDWRHMTAVIALMMIIPLLLEVFFVVPPKALSNDASPGLIEDGMEFKEAARTREFALIGASIFLISISAAGLIPHLAGLSRDLGMAPTQVVVAGSAFGLATVFGRLIFGFVLDRVFAPYAAATFFGLTCLGFILLALSALGMVGPQVNIVAIGLIGLGFAAESDLIGYLTGRYFGLKAFGQIYGVFYMLFLLGFALGPLSYGIARDFFGSYVYVLAAAALIAASAAVLMLNMPAPRGSAKGIAEPTFAKAAM